MPNATTPIEPAGALAVRPDLTVAEKHLLDRIFQHPMPPNLSWREALDPFHAIGSVELVHKGDVVLTLGTDHQSFPPPHDKDLEPQDVMALWHFRTRAG